jgi:hypothetical protein
MSAPSDPATAPSRTGLSGGAAAINLVPTTAKTHPVSGHLGDFVVDVSGRLWFCKGGTLWHQLA